MRKSITFYYPSRSIGGAQNLVIRLAEKLANSKEITIYIIDFEDGFIWSELKNTRNIFLHKIDAGDKISLDDNTTLVIFPSYFEQVRSVINLDTNANLLVWFIQPYLLISLPAYKNLLKFFLPFRIKKVNNLLSELNLHNALLFMDSENFAVNKEYFDFKFEPTYLPIPTPIKSTYYVKKPTPAVNVAWMGRISGEKVNSIKYILNDIYDFNNNNDIKLRFHIIGDGEAMPILKSFLKDAPGTEIIFKSVLTGRELERYLLDEIDCMFAMGTSALDSAAYKVPTILLDFSIKGFEKLDYSYKYKWLYEIQGFTLGQDVNYYKSDNKLTLTEVVKQLNSDALNLIGQRCYHYVYTNHNIDTAAVSLIDNAKKSTFKVKDVKLYNIEYNFIIKYLKKLMFNAN